MKAFQATGQYKNEPAAAAAAVPHSTLVDMQKDIVKKLALDEGPGASKGSKKQR
jgi:hypothetical protein